MVFPRNPRCHARGYSHVLRHSYLTYPVGATTDFKTIKDTAEFGSETYSKEELVAELGASYLVNASGLETSSSFRNSTAYIQRWLSALKDDKRFIVSAASKAEKAVRLILGETCSE